MAIRGPDDEKTRDSIFTGLSVLVSTIQNTWDKTRPDKREKFKDLITEIIEDAQKRIKIFMAGIDEKPEFNEAEYQEKIQRLIEISGTATFNPTEITRNDEWVINGKMIKHKEDKFLKIVFIDCEASDSKGRKRKWKQAIVIREFSQYDKHGCDKIVGQMILPIRINNGVLEAGLTAKRPMGTKGQPSFFAPRWSNSSPTKQPVLTEKGSLVEKIPMRGDSNRLTGVDETRITMFDSTESNQLEDIVWFNTTELKQMTKNEQQPRAYLEDSITIALIYWFLHNQQNILTDTK